MIEFEIKGSGGIRVVPRIPDFSICRIEGRNGIGKSLALRLLELSTGAQPYQAQEKAWQSLRTHLAIAIVTIDLSGGRKLKWTTHPQDWPERAQAPDASWIGTFELNGASLSFEQAQQLFRVRRIAGDRTITDVIADQVKQDALEVSKLKSSYKAASEAIDHELREIAATIRRLDMSELVSLEKEVAANESKCIALASQRDEVASKVSQLRLASQSKSASDKLRSDLPRIDEQLLELESKIEELSVLRKGVEALLRKADEKAEQERAAQLSLDRARKTLANAQDTATEALEKFQEASVRVLSFLPQPWNLEGAKATRRQSREQLQDESKRISKAPRMVKVVEALIDTLALPLNSDLIDETVLMSAGQSISIKELQQFLQQRKADLQNVAPSARTSEIERLILAIDKEQKALDSLELADRAATIAKESVVKAQTKILELTQQLKPSDLEEAQKLSQQLDEIQAERTVKSEERAKLLGLKNLLLEFGEKEELERDIENYAVVYGEPDTWDAQLNDSVSNGLKIEAQIASTKEMKLVLLNSAERLQAGHTAELASVAATNAWLLKALGLSDTSDLRDLIGAQDVVAGFKIRVEETITEIEEIEQPILAVEGTLAGLHEEIRSQTAQYSGPRRPAPHLAIVTHYEEFFGEYFGRKSICDALFGGGNFERLDLNAFSLHWTSQDGVPFSRPLEAFSSGERAFAYTLASLESLDMGDAELKIVALDEFGAFIAQDRLNQLIGFLEEHVIGKVADRIVIVLPVSTDYSSSDENEALPNPVNTRSTDLERDGYVAFDESDRLGEVKRAAV